LENEALNFIRVGHVRVGSAWEVGIYVRPEG